MLKVVNLKTVNLSEAEITIKEKALARLILAAAQRRWRKIKVYPLAPPNNIVSNLITTDLKSIE